MVRHFLLAACLAYFPMAIPVRSGAQTPALPVLTSAQELRALPPQEAESGYPVRLQAVVTLVDPARTIFLQDATGGTFIRLRRAMPEIEPGQFVEVEGVSYPGLYLPGIELRKISVLGRSELPEAKAATFEQLAGGQFNYERVELRGIARAVTSLPERLALTLALGDGRVDVLLGPEEKEIPDLVDARVRVIGLAAGFINDRRQLVGPHLRLRSLADLTVLEPPPDPATLPVTPAAHLLRFSPAGRAGHRVKVRGSVTHQQPGRALFLRDGTQGLMLRTSSLDAVPAGQVVEALGFPAMGTFSAFLEDALFQPVEERAAVAPVPASVGEILTGRHDADLIQLDANLLNTTSDGADHTLLLQEGALVFPARVVGAGAPFASLRPGSRLRLSGVCRVLETEIVPRGFRTNPRQFELLLRSPRTDLQILRQPSWWTARRLAIAAGVLLLAAAAAFTWAALLRRRVRQQTAVIAEKVKAEAALEERQRIAREFHDTLEQELVGLALRLDAAVPKVRDEKPRELLESAQRLVHQLQAGARGFLWNLRDRTFEGATLAEAIAHATADHQPGRSVDVRTTGTPRRLPGVVEHELLRVAQEAVSNAVKHGRASAISLLLEYAPAQLRFTITDNGSGFDPDRDGIKPGHFGLIGMRERVKKLGGDFELRSRRHAGATIEITVPAPP